MKKIGIVTILDNNLGNRLQNYALQETLCCLGYSVETVQREQKNTNLTRYIKYIIKRLLKRKDWKFRNFDRKIRWSPYSLAVECEKEKIAQRYDCFITGSDQVWNPHFSGTNDDAFLTFAPKEKRISYAASFGVSELPYALLGKFGDYLKDFKAVSVREKQAIKIVEQFEGCHAQTVLDPTLLLSRNNWERIAEKSAIKEKYVVKYMLGEDQPDCDKVIKTVLDKIKIVDVKSMLTGNKNPIGPADFLGLVMNAELVCTDSFHAAVFSTIFHKPFVIFERSDDKINMSSRIDSLCEMLELHEHRYSSPSFKLSKLMEPDYGNTDILLEREKNKSLLYLTGAIEN